MTAKHVCFISHGGGPLPLLDPASHAEMISGLQNIVTHLQTEGFKPRAILLISAHWEERVATITSAAKPELIYDYGGFPDAAYQIKYPCVGDPELANLIYLKLQDAGIAARLDEQRGFDHGMFVPMKIMFPNADIPCVQLSLLSSLDASEHLKIGKALAKLDYDSLLVIGSGFSFHNMRAFFTPEDKAANDKNHAFEDWLQQTCVTTELTEQQREQRLAHWLEAPFARFCHPREEHLLPLHICFGISQSHAQYAMRVSILNKQSSMFCW